MEVLFQRQQVVLLLIYLLITLILALEVSRRFVVYATTISPLEASGRLALSEAASARIRFGPVQVLAVVLGTYLLLSWVSGFSLSSLWQVPYLTSAGRILDFVGLPLFLYGAATLLMSRTNWIQRLLAPAVKLLGGELGPVALRHIAVKPHRAVAFLLIVALMAGISIYPTVAARSFEEKAIRGAQVQLGADWQLIFNSPDLAQVDELQGGFGAQYQAILPGLRRLTSALEKVPEVRSANVLVEAILPNFYLPGYGLRGVPMYLIADSDSYLQNVHQESTLGLTDRFETVITGLKRGSVAVSPPVADFWQLSSGTPLILGRDDQQRSVSAPTSGVLAFLPGMPPRSVTDRQGYVQARLDYLNYLFSNNAYLVGAAEDPQLSGLRVLIPRVIVLVNLQPGVAPASLEHSLLQALPFAPLEVHNLSVEIQKAGSDMFIFLALENMRIYLVGGMLLALIGILAVAMANYTEERHTLALLRIRGASPRCIWRFLLATLLSPSLLGLVLGGGAALLAGYGLANYLWGLRELETVVKFLPTHFVVSSLTLGIVLLLLLLLLAVTSLFSLWVFRRTAHETVQEG